MIQTVRKAWGIPELRKKILFTLLILVIYRIGSAIAVPYVDTDMLGTYLNGIVVDHFIFGINIKRRVCVISNQLEPIVNYVLHELHSGATLNEIVGAYDRTPKMEMVTIVDKNEYKKLMDYVRDFDPKAFVTVYSVSDMRYQPKK